MLNLKKKCGLCGATCRIRADPLRGAHTPQDLASETRLSGTPSQEKKNLYFRELVKKEACMFSTVCTRSSVLPFAASVPMLLERFTLGHSCNFLWCCPRMYRQEIKKTFGYFSKHLPRDEKSVCLVSDSASGTGPVPH